MKLGNVNQYINDGLLKECEVHAKLFNPGQRSFEEVLKNTIDGELVEILVCDVFGWDRAPFEIMTYDASLGEDKFEIKHTKRNTLYWTFGNNYNFFIKNSHKLSNIVLCYLDENGDVYLKNIADAPSFSKYVKNSKFNSMKYYDHRIAVKNKDCKVF